MTDGDTAVPVDRFELPVGFRMILRTAMGERSILATEPSQLSPRRSIKPDWSDWLEAFRDQLSSTDFLMREVEADLEHALDVLGRHKPLVTWSADFGWLALLERDRGRVRIARTDQSPEWVESKALSAEVAAESEGSDRRKWIAIEAALFGEGRAPHGGGDSKVSPFARLLSIVHPERSDVLAIFLYAAFSGLLSLAIPVAVQQLVNTVAFGGLVQPVVVLAVLLLIGLSIAAILSAFQAFLAEILQQRIFVRACLDLASRLPRVSEVAFEDRAMPAYVNRFFDLVTLQKTGARLLLEGSAVLLQTATGLLVLSFYHPLMLALSIFLFGTMALVAFSFGRTAPATAIQESAAKYEIAAWMEELVRHPTAFRTSAGRGRAEVRTDGLVAEWVNARRWHYRTVFRQFIAALGLQVIVNTGLLALGGYLVVVGELTLGQLVASEIIVASVVASFSRLAKHFESFYDLLAAVDKVGQLFDLPLERSGPDAAPSDRENAAHISCTEISLTHFERSVVENFSVEFSAGERVGLVSDSAMSLSAFMDLVAGIRVPTKGYITLDGRDLRDMSPEAARNRIALIRFPQIVPGTILENLALGRLEVSIEDAELALSSVGMLDEVRRLPDALETQIDERGGIFGLLGAMRIEIARALIARPRVILLDLQVAGMDDPSMERALDALFDSNAPWSVLAAATNGVVSNRCQRLVALGETSPNASCVESGEIGNA